MKAVVFEKYGPPEVLQIKDIAKPVPRDNEILIRIFATTVSTGDWRMRKPDPALARLVNGLFRPRRIRILGFELAGTVEAVGEGVTRFKTGDEVFAFTGFTFGAYAEYICLKADAMSKKSMVEHKPKNLTLEESAAVPCGALTAQVFTREADIRPGQKVLVYGASGNVGSYALQIAKHLGAHVTGVCGTDNRDMVLSLGADDVIDYKKQDFTRLENRYDILFDAVGKLSGDQLQRAKKTVGRFFSVMKSGPLMAQDLLRIKELVEAGAVRPYIDRTYPMDQIVAAHRYAEAGHKRANVVITIETND